MEKRVETDLGSTVELPKKKITNSKEEKKASDSCSPTDPGRVTDPNLPGSVPAYHR